MWCFWVLGRRVPAFWSSSLESFKSGDLGREFDSWIWGLGASVEVTTGTCKDSHAGVCLN